MGTTAYYMGVDSGATNVRSVVGDDDGTVLEEVRDNTPRGPTGIAVTEAILGVVREVCVEAGIDPSDVVAVGAGAIGPLDLAEGAVENPANLLDTIDRIPLTGPLSALLETDEVYLHNDTNVDVIGERLRSDRNLDDMVYPAISFGTGAGVCVDEHVPAGWNGNTGEVGYLTLDPHGFMTCGRGHNGHWEGYCSGNNIPKYARELHEEDPVDTTLLIFDPDFSAVDVFEHAGDDGFADHAISQLGHWNAMGVANIVHVYAPPIIYAGGAVTLNNPDLVSGPTREQMSEMAMSNIPEIQLMTPGDEVVVEGALASATTGGTGDRSWL